jgi:protease-4
MGEQSSGSDSLVGILSKAGRDDGIKAVVIRVNSPGGSAAASQEIYNAIVRLKKKKPVIISMADVAASGGYYISSAADKIFADPATLTGSIGVIFSSLNYEGLFKKYGLEGVTIKSVKYKDIGSPYRKMLPEERAILQSSLNSVHQQFVRDVAKGRKMKVEDVAKIADGRVFTGEQAQKLNLVDNLGGMHEAVEYAAKKVGLKLPAEIDYLQKESPFSMFFNTLSGIRPEAVEEMKIKKLAETLLMNPLLDGQ